MRMGMEMGMGLGMRMGLVIGLAIPILIPIPIRAQNKSVDKAVAAWKNVKSMSGTFEQTLTNPLMRSTATAKGTFAQQQPNKISIRFTDPANDAIVADGTNLWVFLQQAAPGQVIKRPISDQLASPIDIGQFLNSPATKYDIVAKGADTLGGRAVQAVNLTPRRGVEAPFTKATVWIDETDGLIRQFEVTESTGLVRRIRLTKLNLNPAIPAAEFRFAIPKGIRVVER
jgi:outer membrane lipoprotein carrier protein